MLPAALGQGLFWGPEVIFLTSEERADLDSAEAVVSKELGVPVSFDRLRTSWLSFVEEVADGYTSNVDDYINDLTTRDLIERLIRATPDHLSVKLKAAVEPLDARFRECTVYDGADSLAKYYQIGENWWWHRLPSRMVGALRSTLHPPG